MPLTSQTSPRTRNLTGTQSPSQGEARRSAGLWAPDRKRQQAGSGSPGTNYELTGWGNKGSTGTRVSSRHSAENQALVWELDWKRFLLTASRPQLRKQLTSWPSDRICDIPNVTGAGAWSTNTRPNSDLETLKPGRDKGKTARQAGEIRERDRKKKTPVPAKLQNMMSTPIISTTRT